MYGPPGMGGIGGLGHWGGRFDPYTMSQYMDPWEHAERMQDMMEMEYITPVQYIQYINLCGNSGYGCHDTQRSRMWPERRSRSSSFGGRLGFDAWIGRGRGYGPRGIY